jgi:hypothetical protein
MALNYSWWEPFVMGFVFLVLAWFVISTVVDMVRRLFGPRDEFNFIEYEVTIEDHRPVRHPDPTRPSDDEHNVIEYRRK